MAANIAPAPAVQEPIGTKGWLSRLEQGLATRSWQQARLQVNVKLVQQEDELYVFVQSAARINQEHAMRRKRLKWLWTRLKTLQARRPTCER